MKVIFISSPCGKLAARRGGVYVVSRDGSKVFITPDVDQVIVASSRVSVTSKAVRLLARYGVDLVFLEHNGYPAARLYPPHINKTVATRIAQYEGAIRELGLGIAREIVLCKIANQAQLLKYLAKNYREEWLRDVGYELDALATSLYKIELGSLTSEKLMNLEAQAARKYWQAVAFVVPEPYGFNGRDPEGFDPFNLSLNYGYGILYSICEKSLVLAGLDPYLGVLHATKSGKPSLTLDFAEMFKPIAVDKPLIVNARRVKVEVVDGRIDYESRGRIAEEVLKNLNVKYRSSKEDRILPLQEHIRREAWDLAKCFREGLEYEGFRVYL
ncbi:MAG: CRISPR-associated endonuclease Cas1 [Candidatus Nezhaarchaeales archaeon]